MSQLSWGRSCRRSSQPCRRSTGLQWGDNGSIFMKLILALSFHVYDSIFVHGIFSLRRGFATSVGLGFTMSAHLGLLSLGIPNSLGLTYILQDGNSKRLY